MSHARGDAYEYLTVIWLIFRAIAIAMFYRCRFLKDGAAMPQSKGTVMNSASGFKNGIKVATAAEMAEDDNEEEEEEDDHQDWKLDTSDEAVAERRMKELDLITRVEKIMNAGLGDKAKGKGQQSHSNRSLNDFVHGHTANSGVG